MSYQTRRLSDPPDYFNKLTTKQKRNWRKTTKKIEKNEELRTRYRPFQSSSNTTVIHLHYKSTINIIDELITKVKQTTRYVLDTESEKGERNNQGALIQIQFVHSISQSTIILIETNYLPNPQSILFARIEELCSIIFSNNNEIISWGTIAEEFEHFHYLGLIHLGKNIDDINLQCRFSDWKNNSKTHPEMERRDEITGHVSLDMLDISGDDDDMDDEQPNYNFQVNTHQQRSNIEWSLQAAVATTLDKFLDKTETINHWKCGLNFELNTWQNKLFSHNRYDKQIEQTKRLKMKQYAIDDCTSVTEIFFTMYPSKINHNNEVKNEIPPATTATTTTRRTILDLRDDLSDISEDELIEILKQKFDKPQITLQILNEEPATLTIQATAEEMNEFNLTDEQPQQSQTTTTTTLTKAERQKKKKHQTKMETKTSPQLSKQN
ncbi:unnamed protein product [Rotaria magnacalcarata]|uniref:Uncharacterized protein n=2 Tax=Rotaria magnacalcarata TaxID=392030 RepID=A0A820NKA3_9BILA|nr:unnamed protein product [Rotaria magnacalcarata]CAF4390038.1 unnamed protein product [Rotaria magnacalcarata]